MKRKTTDIHLLLKSSAFNIKLLLFIFLLQLLPQSLINRRRALKLWCGRESFLNVCVFVARNENFFSINVKIFLFFNTSHFFLLLLLLILLEEKNTYLPPSPTVRHFFNPYKNKKRTLTFPYSWWIMYNNWGKEQASEWSVSEWTNAKKEKWRREKMIN